MLLVVVILCMSLFGPIIKRQGSNSMLPAGNVSSEIKAVEIALPLAQAYVQENNRTILSTEVTLRVADRSYWLVEFETTVIEKPGGGYPRVNVYEVTVWADTGEIYHHGIVWISGSRDGSNGREAFKISVDQAIEIALPFAQMYAQENNRVITTKVSVDAGYVNSRPGWQVDIFFEPIAYDKHSVQYYIYGYAVLIWGDTGEIRHHGEQGSY